MAITPKEKPKLSPSDKKLIAKLENVIDSSVRDGTAHKDLNSFYIELPKIAFKLTDIAESALLSKYKSAGWKDTKMDNDYRENIAGIRLYK